MATIGEMLNLAMADHQAGRFAEAESVYRQILAQVPQHSDVWHLLGVLAYQVGKPAEAVPLIEKAIALVDGIGVYYANLGEALRVLGEHERAEMHLRRSIELDPQQIEGRNNLALLLQHTRRAAESLVLLDMALALRPDYAEARNNRGLALELLTRVPEAIDDFVLAARLKSAYSAPLENLARIAFGLHQQGALALAAEVFERIVHVDPRSAAAWSNLGAIRFQQGQYTATIDACRRAIELNPAHADAWNNLGSAQLRLLDYLAAERSLQRALEIQPQAASTLNNLGLLFMQQQRFADAGDCYRRTLALEPNNVAALQSLGLIDFRQARFAAARAWYERALQLEPNNADTLNKLGTCIMAQGEPAEAVGVFARALDCDPAFVVAHSNQVFCHLYLPEITLPQLAEVHREFYERHARRWAERCEPHTNRREADRRLRVGFVSADLRHHPIGFLLSDVFGQLDPQQVELVCYSTRHLQDDLTHQLRQRTVLWRDVEYLSDDELAAIIRHDAIDVLVDLAGHTSGNRLLTFARRPAPVQVTWMGYPSTTGIPQIDYLLSDAWMAPESFDPYFAERIYRLPQACACYRVPVALPELAPPPVSRGGPITFGSFNNSAKINPQVVALWSRAMQAVPGSRMFLKFRALNEPDVQGRLVRWFAEQGIDRSRLEFEPHSPLPEMLRAYGRVDVALDTWPYTGGTTTMLALLMGVPVVTCPGATLAARQSFSVLSQAGCTTTVAASVDDFVRVAATLASNPRQLSALRPELRQQMLRSPYCDAPRFAAQFTTALRQMWHAWLERPEA